MSIFERHPRARWALPVAAAAVIGGVAVLPSPAKADSLTPRTAQQLLTDVLQAKVDGLSGTVSETTDLGLPTLPAGLGGGSSDTSLQGLVTGTHTARVWAAGDTLSRVSVQAGAQETNIVHNGTSVWEWQSKDQTATHFLLPAGTKSATSPTSRPSGAPDVPATPQQLAQRLVKDLSSTSTVTTADNQLVAGRPAYELVLTPKDPASRVASVRIAIDGDSHVPTRVQVFSTKTGTAAIQVGFTSVSFTRPDSSVFAFSPAKGVTVTTKDLTHQTASGKDGAQKKPSSGTSSEKVVGTGWTSVVTGHVDLKALAAQKSSANGSANQLAQLVNLLPSAAGAWGSGHVLDGTLFSVVLTTDGRYAVGAVAPSALYAALPAK